MKPLDKSPNTEKAILLYQLFPTEIPAFIDFMNGVCDSIQEREQDERDKWQNGIMTFDYWLALVKEAKMKINVYGKRLNTNRTLFADQLFGGMQASYAVYCLHIYITVRKHPNAKFAQAIDLLFL